ncbi:XRE family transcriptional regulator [Streptomyces lavendulae]|nr:XRE family transcriptional regulator [Streptomyces lavendulae]
MGGQAQGSCTRCRPLTKAAPMARTFSGRRLREARHAAGLTAEQLADAVDRSPWAVWRWERDAAQPSIGTADRLADAVGVALPDLLADDRAAVA